MCGAEGRAVWQVSGGPAMGWYGETFLRYGVALVGPGDPGPWRPDRKDSDFGGSAVRRFAEELSVGDIVLLRTGNATVNAVGLVASDYLYLPQFDDVNGCDVQHGRRVRWYRLPDRYDFGSAVFAGAAVFSRVSAPDVIDYAVRFADSEPRDWHTATLPPLPKEEPPLHDVPAGLRDIVAHVQDLADLYWDGGRFGDLPTEDELVAHYVVPLLRVLGWRVEQIAVKWRYVDVALFRELPRTPENCAYIVEAKRLGSGVEGALGQAKQYLGAIGVSRDIIVTDGIRYRLYSSAKDFAPVAYANLARLKQPALGLFERIRPR